MSETSLMDLLSFDSNKKIKNDYKKINKLINLEKTLILYDKQMDKLYERRLKIQKLNKKNKFINHLI